MTLVSILYLILAILGLSFLVFIHELGHYFMARRRGMRVETFSVGFGKPIYKWVKDGVNWQIGVLPFGGYVKIAGMEMSDESDIYEVKDGFFGKHPLDRIVVALAGPVVNIAFAYLAFTGLWMMGGREKKFSDYTHKIGWIDPKSELYMKGVRVGDEITHYNHHPYLSSKDHMIAPMMSSNSVNVKGFHVDFHTKQRTPFEYAVKPYQLPYSLDKDRLTTGIYQSASYIIYGSKKGDGNKNQSVQQESVPTDPSDSISSRLRMGDRIIWADGVPVYSLLQLNSVLNDSKALLTIKRDGEVFLRRVPRVLAEELKFDQEFREELIDWQFEAGLNENKIQKLYTIPYNLNNNCIVEAPIQFIDREKEEEFFPTHSQAIINSALQTGDKILAVDGITVNYSYEILKLLQKKISNVIVQRQSMNHEATKIIWHEADQVFDQQYKPEDLQKLVSQIGLSSKEHEANNLYLLDKLELMTRKDYDHKWMKSEQLAKQNAEKNKLIDGIDDPVKKAQYSLLLEQQDKQFVLGLSDLSDAKVIYNPTPTELFKTVSLEIFHTLKALFTGTLNPKWMSGPVGIVHVVHEHSKSGISEAIYWLGAISLNLGLLNLLPLPVLDGGTICIAFYELVTGKRLKAKTLERFIIPFALLLIGFFIFLTYNDLMRIFT